MTKFTLCRLVSMLMDSVRCVEQKKSFQQKLLESNADLEIIYSISKSLVSTLDMEELSWLIVNEITTKLGISACLLGLLDSSGHRLYVKSYSGEFFYGVKSLNEFTIIDVRDSLLEKALNTGEILRSDNILTHTLAYRINQNRPEDERVKDIIFIPIVVKNRKIGILVTGSLTAFEERDLRLLSSIANNAAIAINNALLYETSKKYYMRTIDALVAAVEAKDKYIEGHSQRVSMYSARIAHKLGMSVEQVEDIKVAGILHDIGKIGISDKVLLKPSRLTNEEYEEIKLHPAISTRILNPVGFSDRTLKAINHHHERYDGKGYPHGLSGNEITIEAQIIAVADAFDAMTSKRSYRDPMRDEDALSELIANKSIQFNPLVVDAMVELVKMAGVAS